MESHFLLALAAGALAIAGSAANADTLLNYTFNPGSTYTIVASGGTFVYTATGGFTYDATTSAISNVTYTANPGGYDFTAATVNSPTDVTFINDQPGDTDEYYFAQSLALGGTDLITGGAFPSNSAFVVTASGSVSAGVPEPATWALMLMGFGTAGAGLRGIRRQRAMA